MRFMNVKTMAGELKRTEIRRGLAFRLTTKEVILLREDVTYYMLLEDILGVTSRDDEEAVHNVRIGDTNVPHAFGGTSYKIVATKMRIYNRSGVFEKGSSTIYASLSEEFCRQLIELLQA